MRLGAVVQNTHDYNNYVQVWDVVDKKSDMKVHAAFIVVQRPPQLSDFNIFWGFVPTQ